MKSLMRAGLVLALPAVLLAGCGGGDNKKTVATVNGDKITEDEFNSRVRDVTVLQLGPPFQQMRAIVKAGEFTMQTLVIEKLWQQLAKEKNAIPTEAEVNTAVPLAKKWPQNFGLIADPTRTDETWRRDVRLVLIQRKLAMAPLKVTDEEIKKEYESVKGQMTPETEYHLGVINLKSEAKAAKALDTLKTGIAFETVALTQSEEPMSKARQGDIGWIPSSQIPPDLLAAVKALKPGEYTKKAIRIQRPNPQTGKNELNWLIARLVETKPGTPPTPEEAEPAAVTRLIVQKDPSAFQRVQEDLIKFKDRAKIEIAIKGYEKLFDKTAQPAGAPGGAPGGAPAPAPSATPTGAPAGAPPAPAATPGTTGG